MDCIKRTLTLLVGNYDIVCYIPGNHELWELRRNTTNSKLNAGKEFNSIDKFADVLNTAIECGAYVGPVRVQSLVRPYRAICTIPLYSWYHPSFDSISNSNSNRAFRHSYTAPTSNALSVSKDFSFEDKWVDFNLCKWPPELISQEEFRDISVSNKNTVLATLFAAINEPFIRSIKPPSLRTLPAALDTANIYSKSKTSIVESPGKRSKGREGYRSVSDIDNEDVDSDMSEEAYCYFPASSPRPLLKSGSTNDRQGSDVTVNPNDFISSTNVRKAISHISRNKDNNSAVESTSEEMSLESLFELWNVRTAPASSYYPNPHYDRSELWSPPQVSCHVTPGAGRVGDVVTTSKSRSSWRKTDLTDLVRRVCCRNTGKLPVHPTGR